ncbi:MAG: DUF4124 domain-containing protein [Betaproteobacteria bacterium]|nr:DUF4124 domain-containing protein [Betaproteobacteria bacterium]
MYKWVDERGVVTYTNVPPPDARSRGKLELIAPGFSAVSTYSSAESLGINGNPAREMQVRELRARLERLERELDAERRARFQAEETTRAAAASKASQEAQRRREWRERCLADRRVDCDRADLAEEVTAPVLVVARVVRPILVRPVAPGHWVPGAPPRHHPHAGLHRHFPESTTPLLRHPSRPWAVPPGATLVLKSGQVRRH